MNQAARPIDVFDRVWTDGEITASPLTARLQAVPAIFSVRQRQVELAPHGGPLSLKMVAAGVSAYRFDRRLIRVSPGHLLMVAAGDRYATLVDETADIVTAYLPQADIRGAAWALTASPEESLDAPDELYGGPLDFAPHLRADTGRLRAYIDGVARIADGERRAEHLTRLSGKAARLALEAVAAIQATDARRPAVRRELFRRASLARTRLESDPATPASLNELARIAALSPFHLLRVFTRAFGESPAQMRRRLCLERAQDFLRRGAMPVGDVAAAAGFNNAAAFSRAFRRATGIPPSTFQRNARAGAKSQAGHGL